MTTHVLKLENQTLVLEVTEHPEKIEARAIYEPYGDLGNADQMREWAVSVFDKYKDDPRPIFVLKANSGDVFIAGKGVRVIIMRSHTEPPTSP